MPEDLSKYKDTYLSEGREHLASMNKSLLELEKEPAKVERVNDIFREVHTLKSMAATMNYNQTARLCHALEDVLDGIKKKKVKLESCADVLFECFDTLELSIKEISKGKEELASDTLVIQLQTLLRAGKKIGITSNESRTTNDESRVTNPESGILQMERIQSIEVKVERLDHLMNLAEELLINKMRLDRIKEELEDSELTATVDLLGRLVTDIQYNVMQSRMVPVGFVFNRFPRMVRDLARQQKKEINLEMQGSDIELDRSVIDEIGESLVHILRNAVDHGIEEPQERKKVGKPPQGLIRLVAKRTKNFVVIEISEDGAGLDIQELKNTAVRRGILSPQASQEDIINSIFSGVSTTKKVTAVSGRGFGLNIVKNKIESLGGTIKVTSEPKKGTTFVIEIPLTLAIIKTLLVKVGSKIYAIPLGSIERLVSVNQEDIKGMMNHEAIVLNEEEIPITRLDVLFSSSSLALEKQPIAIIRRGQEKLGLAVDRFLTAQEIVIKPLNRLVRENKYFSGITIIGSGEVVLILDVANLMLTRRNIEIMKQEAEY